VYKYGFNGKEKDDEVYGGGNEYDFGARIYDSRLSRFLSTDPMEGMFPWQSPYVFADNSPIALIDLLGMAASDPVKSKPHVTTTPGPDMTTSDGKVHQTEINTDQDGVSTHDVATSTVVIRPKGASQSSSNPSVAESFSWGFLKAAVPSFIIGGAIALVVGVALTAASPVIVAAGIMAAAAAAAAGTVGVVKGGYEALSGNEAYTGRKLSNSERAEKAGEVAGGLAGGYGLKKAYEIKVSFKPKIEKTKIQKQRVEPENWGCEFVDDNCSGAPKLPKPTAPAEVAPRAPLEVNLHRQGNNVGGDFGYSNGEKIDFMADRNVFGNRLELTNCVFYPKGVSGNEMANTFKPANMRMTLESLKVYAKSQGFKELRIQYQRGQNSSSKNPGHFFDETFKIK
jgi:RHS repeat-associated protein